MELKLILTFDHELPLGGVRTSYNDAMFEPTYQLLQLAGFLETPVVLFTDVLCGIQFREWDAQNFYKPYIKQLRKAVSQDHDVQLHLHPHWLTTSFKDNTFTPSKDFRLSDFRNNATYPIDRIVQTGVDFLREVCGEVKPNYKCVAFRAGGFNLEGATDEIITALYQNGIRFDSSVVKGYYFRSALSEVNFLNMPDVPNWFIGFGGDLRKQSDEGLLEIPLASIPKTPFEVPTRFKLKRFANRAPRDHGFMIHEGNPADLRSKIKMLFSARPLSFDNYTLSVNYLMRVLKYNVNKYRENDQLILSVIGHPKSMGKYSFKLMEDFVKRVRQTYPKAEFTTFSKLYDEMKMA